jgi:carboxymethylenebutenolidase
MAIKGEWIKYGDQTGYFAFPEYAAKPIPGVIVIQQIMGVDEHIEDVTRRIAAAGYAALAPDIYAVSGIRPEALSAERIREAMAFAHKLPPGAMFDRNLRETEALKLDETERKRIFETFGLLFGGDLQAKIPGYVKPLRTAVRYLRNEQPETKGQKIGCVGFCMGGGLSALLACEEPEISGAAIYYGNFPSDEQTKKIGCPLIGFFGEKDERINRGIPAFAKAFKNAGKTFEHFIYAGAGHAFFDDTGPMYEVAAARDSFSRLLGFFRKNLGEA